ncbi:MAG: RND transporter [Cypionkella sp.]|nr:RND transporter [Cypionkella sp.]
MQPVLDLIDQIPLNLVIIAALTLGLAPFFPEPHITEKIRMLMAGNLSKPVDIFDFLMHAAPFALLAAKTRPHGAPAPKAIK